MRNIGREVSVWVVIAILGVAVIATGYFGITGREAISRFDQAKLAMLDERDRADAFQYAAEVSTAARVVLDDREQVIVWSPGASALTGWLRRERIGKNLDDIMPEELRQKHHDKFAAAASDVKTRVVTQVTCSVVHRDGSSIPVQIMIRSYNSDGRQFYVGVIDRIADIETVKVE